MAVIGVVGPRAKRVVDCQFHSASGPLPAKQSILKWGQETEARRCGDQEVSPILFGRWGGPQGEEVVVCHRLLPKAKAPCAGAQTVEVHCHGGRQAAHRILDSLVAQKCQVILWQEWIRQQALDLLQAEAHIELAAAGTQRTAAILLDQYQGALHREIAALKEEIVSCRDNPDWPRAAPARKLAALLARVDIGSHLRWPWQVVLAGRPNVGKSSLLNGLLGYARAIVFDQPGTTRDILSATTAMEGWPVQLSDTAGMHDSSEPLELQGIGHALEQLSQADLLIWVLDGTGLGKAACEDNPEEILRLAQQQLADVRVKFPAELPILMVLNKVDLVRMQGSWPLPERRNETESPSLIPTSAITGEGIDLLIAAIVTHLVPHAPAPGDGVPFNDRQQRLLQHASSQLQQAHFQQAIAALDELLGITKVGAR